VRGPRAIAIRPLFPAIAGAILLCLVCPGRAWALVVDLSDHLIAIDTDYTGTEVVLFGTIDEPGDIVIVVRGPPRTVEVRRKERVGGIWVNGAGTTFSGVPGYYGFASTQPVALFASDATLDRREIGLEHLQLTPESDLSQAQERTFGRALILDYERRGLYRREPSEVTFVDPRLFRTLLRFPSNIPTGQYTVDVFQFRNGEVIAAFNTPLIVSRTGVGAQIFRFAHTHAIAYGLIAIVIAVAAGWLAGAIFRRA